MATKKARVGKALAQRSEPLIAALEPRMLLSGTPIGIGLIPSTYNIQALAPLSLNTTNVVAGDTLTVTIDDLAESTLTVGCSQAISATVDGSPAGGPEGVPPCYQYDSSTLGEPVPDVYARTQYEMPYAWDVSVGPGVHTLIFTISSYAPTEGQTMSVENVNPSGNPFDETFYSGPWVVAGGPSNIDLGDGQYFSSEVPFTITGTATGVTSSLQPTISKSTLPASAVAGANPHGNAIVKLTNTGATTEIGVAKIAIYASSDGTIDSSSMLVGMASQKVDLKTDKDVNVTVPVKKLSASLDGDYSLLVGITDPKGNTAAVNYGPSITVGPPTVSLVPTYAYDLPGKHGTATLIVTITNNGNIASTGISTIAVDTSTDGIASTASPVDTQHVGLHIAPGKSHTQHIKLTAAQFALLQASPAPLLQITDHLGGTQSLTLQLY